jgi:CRP-like cAMP-binding protein
VRRPLDTIRPFRLLRDLSDAELEVLLRHATEVTLARGEYLFREGDPGDALYLIHEGIMVAERLIDPVAGTRKDLAILPSFNFVGEMALADSSPRSASLRAELPVKAYRISRANFEKVMAESPIVASKIFRALFAETAQRLRVTNEELVAVYEVGRFVAAAADPKGVAEAVIKSLALRLDASYALVAFYDPDKNQLRVAYATGERAASLPGVLIPLDSGLAKTAYDEKKPILVERLLGATDPWESESMILAPLVVRDAAVGLMVLGAPGGGKPYRIADLSLAAAVSNISAPVLRDAFAAR